MENIIDYRGKKYQVIADNETEIVICDITKKHLEIHISKDSERYEDFDMGGGLDIEKPSGIYLINTKPSIFNKKENPDEEITSKDYESEIDLDYLSDIAFDDTQGKHSTKEILIKELGKRETAIIPFMYFLLCYAERNKTKTFYEIEVAEKIVKRDDYKASKANTDDWIIFKRYIDEIDKEKAPNIEEMLKLIPDEGKYHITTALCGFAFYGKLNLTKKDCLAIIDYLEAKIDLVEDF